MRFVPVNSEKTQGAASVFRVRELLIRQRPQAINALRGHLIEYDWVVPQGATNAQHLMTIPGIGPLVATAIATLAPPADMFRKGRDFAAWLGLTPRQHSTGGKTVCLFHRLQRLYRLHL